MTAAVSPSQEYQTIRRALMCGKSGCACAKGPNVHCPAHEDAHPSLTLSVVRNRVLWNCKTNCSQAVVTEALKALGLLEKQEAPARTPPLRRDSGGRLVAEYEYPTAEGELIAVKARFETADGKYFRWRLPGGEYKDGLGGLALEALPLWGAPQIAAAPDHEPVIVVEGEKAATACRERSLLGVCHAGGASTVKFGDSLAILKGRHVILWPDNDEPGRGFMARVAAQLRGVAGSVRTIAPPLPDKGDAFDYFAAGGTAADLLADLPPTEATVDYLPGDLLRLRLPSPAGLVTVDLADIQRTRRGLEAELLLRANGHGPERPYVQHLNLLSSSARAELRRDLDTIYGREFGWAALLNAGIALARDAYTNRDRAVELSEVDVYTAQDIFFCEPLITANAPNIAFGDGSAYKTFISLALALACAEGAEIAGFRLPRVPVLIVDYESTAEVIARRLNRLSLGIGLWATPPGIHYWAANGIPFADLVEPLARKIERDGIGLLILDSIGPACGGKPEEAEVALAFFRALSKLRITSWLLAHITKGGENNTEKPFGSNYWHNMARRTWYVYREQEEDSSELDLGLFCRKVNDGTKPRPITVHVSFADPEGPVTLTRESIQSVPQINQKRPLGDRIFDVLTLPLSPSQIAERVGADAPSVTATMRRESYRFIKVDGFGAGGRGNEARWARVERRAR